MKKKRFAVLVFVAFALTFACVPVAAWADAGGVLLSSNNSRDNAQPISIGEQITSSLSSSNDTDFFKFTLSAAGKVSITFGSDYEDSTRYWRFYVLNADGSQLGATHQFAAEDSTDTTTADLGLPAGTYYVKVYTYSSSTHTTVNYHFRVNFEARSDWETIPNGSRDNANRIAVGSTYYGTLETSDDNDFFKFTLNADGKVSITFGSDYEDSTRYWRFYVLNADGSQLGATHQFSAEDSTDTTTADLGLPAGTYYVKVYTYGSSTHTTVNYHFRVNFEARSDWETIPNGSRDNANRIAVGSTYYGTLETSDDNDFFKFTLSAAGKVSITFGSDYEDSTRYWRVAILDSAGKVVNGYDTFQVDSGTDLSSKTYDLSSGEYYVKIYTYGSSTHTTTNYHFKVNLLSNYASSNYGFTDVSGDEWFATDDILGYATENGLINGYSNGAFGPYDNITRGQVATILWRMAGEPSASAADFSDVNYSIYYGDAIRWARAQGVISGYGATNTFAPDSYVTRQELCVMLANYAKQVGGVSIATTGSKLASMPDAGDVSSWAQDAVAWCMDESIVTGAVVGSSSYVQPGANAQRCAAAKMVAVLDRDVLK